MSQKLCPQRKSRRLDTEDIADYQDHAQLAHNMESLDHEHWMDEDDHVIKPPETETSAKPTEKPATSQNETGYHNKYEEEAGNRAAKAVQQKFPKFTITGKNSDPATAPKPSQIKRFFDNTSGSLDYKKVQTALLARAKPIKDWVIQNVMPEMFSEKARYADPRFAEYNVSKSRMNEQIHDELDSEWYAFNGMKPYDQVSFMTRYEQGIPQDAAWKDRTADRIRDMLDNAYKAELAFGSKAEYVENYLSHLFENEGDINAFKIYMKKTYGPTWFQKERGFNTINDALAAGLKLKYTNPIEIVSRRLMAGADMMLKMQLLHNLNSMGLAHPIGEVPKGTGTTGWQTIGAPNRSDWILAPDVQALWKNGVDAKGLWANEGTVGSVFRGWMKLKSVWAPIKLSLSAFHPLHVALGVLQADNFARS